jgi:hypothetical protein
MSTIINNPHQDTGGMSGVAIALAILLAGVGVVLFFYGIPSLQKEDASARSITVPDTIKVDVTTPQQN